METKEFIKNRRDKYIDILKDLIRQDTSNPPGNEHLAASVITKHLDNLKISYKIHEKVKGRSNVIATIGKKGKQILFSAHLDVVPAGDGWDTDPFNPVIKDGELYGRGSTDNKAQCTAILLIAEYLKSIEDRINNRFLFIWAADEECGSKYGIKYLIKEKILKPDLAIIPDVGGNLKLIDIAEKGIANIEVTAIGKSAHGAYPHLGKNAIDMMSQFLIKLDSLELKHEKHKYLSGPTINIGTITGGTAPNSVPGKCTAVINIRYLPSQDIDSIIKELKTLTKGEFEFKILIDLPPTEMDENHALVKTILATAKKHGIKAKPNGLNGGTDTKSFILAGIPAVGYDFVADDLAHAANEHVTLDNLFKFAEIMIDVCEELDKNA